MEQKTCELSFGKLAYIEHQPSNDMDAKLLQQPTLIAIHGWLDNAASFIPLMHTLAGFHWIAIDLPGHGESSHRPAGAFYHFIDYVSDLIEFIDHLDLATPPIIVGHSLGGLLATVLAGLFPDRIKKLVLIDAAGLYTQNDKSVVADMREGLENRIGLTSKVVRQPLNLDSAIKARQKAGNLSFEAAKYLVTRNTKVDPNSNQLMWRTDIRLRAKSPLRIDNLAATEIIKNISVPVLLVLGTDGYDSVKDNLAEYEDCYANLTTKTIAGNHHVHLENPTETAAQIKKFLL